MWCCGCATPPPPPPSRPPQPARRPPLGQPPQVQPVLLQVGRHVFAGQAVQAARGRGGGHHLQHSLRRCPVHAQRVDRVHEAGVHGGRPHHAPRLLWGGAAAAGGGACAPVPARLRVRRRRTRGRLALVGGGGGLSFRGAAPPGTAAQFTPPPHHVLPQVAQFFQSNGLDQKVDRAVGHAAQNDVGVSVGGHHDDLGGGCRVGCQTFCCVLAKHPALPLPPPLSPLTGRSSSSPTTSNSLKPSMSGM